MTQAIDPVKLKAAAEHLEWVLRQHQDEPTARPISEWLMPLMLLCLLSIILLAGCKPKDSASETSADTDTTSLEHLVASLIAKTGLPKPVMVKCPRNLDHKVGDVVRCTTIDATGNHKDFNAHATKVSPIGVEVVAREIVTHVGREHLESDIANAVRKRVGGIPVSAVSCPDNLQGNVGVHIRCTVDRTPAPKLGVTVRVYEVGDGKTGIRYFIYPDIDIRMLEQQLARMIAKEGISFEKIECMDDLKEEKGSTSRCIVTTSGRRRHVFLFESHGYDRKSDQLKYGVRMDSKAQ